MNTYLNSNIKKKLLIVTVAILLAMPAYAKSGQKNVEKAKKEYVKQKENCPRCDADVKSHAVYGPKYEGLIRTAQSYTDSVKNINNEYQKTIQILDAESKRNKYHSPEERKSYEERKDALITAREEKIDAMYTKWATAYDDARTEQKTMYDMIVEEKIKQSMPTK